MASAAGSDSKDSDGKSAEVWEPKKTGDQTFTATITWSCRPKDIFGAFTDPRDIMRYTRSEAKVDLKPGGEFSMFGGSIHGRIAEVEKHTKLVQYWRFRDWAEDVYSKVEFTFEEIDEGETEMVLKHTGIPSTDKHGNQCTETTRRGWQDRIFRGIKQFLGYGMEVEEVK